MPELLEKIMTHISLYTFLHYLVIKKVHTNNRAKPKKACIHDKRNRNNFL